MNSIESFVDRSATDADIDNDGSLDVLMITQRRPGLFLSRESGTNHSLGVKMRGTRSNHDGIGALLRIVAGKDQQSQICALS